MKIPNPYFTDVPKFGDLHVDEILLEDVYPILFTLKNEDGELFLCLCCEIRNEQRWILNPISNKNLIALLTNMLTIRKAFTDGAENKIVAVRDYSTEQDTFKIIPVQKLDPDDLPSEDELLDADDGEFNDYIERLESFNQANIYKSFQMFSYSFSFETTFSSSVIESYMKNIASKKCFNLRGRRMQCAVH